MNTKSATATLTLIFTLLLSLGCTMAPHAVKPDTLSEAAYPKISLIGPFQSQIVHGIPSEQSSSTQPLHVSVPLRLKSEHPLKVKYRFQFFDVKGELLTPEMGWRDISLPPRANTYIQATATQITAHDWKIQIKPEKYQF